MPLGRYEAVAAVPHGVGGKGFHLPPPDRQTRYMKDILRCRRGFGGCKLWILLKILSETVMGKMEIAKPVGGQCQHEACDPRDGLIQPCRAKRGLMDRLMQQGEQEGDGDALRDHEQGPERYFRRDEGA